MDYTNLSNKQLLTLLGQNDRKAFQAIFELYWQDCYRIAISKLNTKELAEEATQNIFISLWERRNHLEINNLQAYLFASVKFQAINFIKDKLITKKQLAALPNSLKVQNDVEQYFFQEDLVRTMEIVMERLPQKTKLIYRLSRYEHLTGKEIAFKLNLSEKSVEYHISKALKILRLELKDYLVYGQAGIVLLATLS